MPGIAIACSPVLWLTHCSPGYPARGRSLAVPAGDASLFLTGRQVRTAHTEGDPMGDYRPSHFGICVRDLGRSLRFFCDGLGFEPAECFELDSVAAEGLDRSLEVAGPVRIVSQFIENDTMKI